MHILSVDRVNNFWQLVRKWISKEHDDIKNVVISQFANLEEHLLEYMDGDWATDEEIYAMFPGVVDENGEFIVNVEEAEDEWLEGNITVDEEDFITINNE